MRPPSIDPSNVNSLWASVAVETLHRCGVRDAVVCPGSRSAPLAFALAAHSGIRAVSVLDERSAGFFALGLAKATGRPAALVCTSGTAAANFLPAVVEARESAVPFLVLTADRPPELRDCAAGQAIDQQKLYGSFPVFYHELALPRAEEGMLAYLRQTLLHACQMSLGPEPGPVHLNVPFRGVLVPQADPGGRTAAFVSGIDWKAFFGRVRELDATRVTGPIPELPRGGRGVIVAGPAESSDPAAYAGAVGAISRRLGWPVLADALSPVRHHASAVPMLVSSYDAILKAPGAGARLAPEFVLCLEGWPTSKALREWVEGSGADVWLASPRPANRDALHGRTEAIASSVAELADAFKGAAARPGPYAAAWMAREGRAREAMGKAFSREKGLFEPNAVRLLAGHLPVATSLFVSSSMPVRDAEFFWPANDRGIRLYFNRGANGIDGTLSTAMGIAHGGGSAVLLTGDLAFLHDINGLLIGPKLRGSLTVVLVNNRGGGIFGHLPVARFDPPFEEFFATPQSVDFAMLCKAHSVAHFRPDSWEEFVPLVSRLPEKGVRVIELVTDRKADVEARRRLIGAAWK